MWSHRLVLRNGRNLIIQRDSNVIIIFFLLLPTYVVVLPDYVLVELSWIVKVLAFLAFHSWRIVNHFLAHLQHFQIWFLERDFWAIISNRNYWISTFSVSFDSCSSWRWSSSIILLKVNDLLAKRNYFFVLFFNLSAKLFLPNFEILLFLLIILKPPCLIVSNSIEPLLILLQIQFVLAYLAFQLA